MKLEMEQLLKIQLSKGFDLGLDKRNELLFRFRKIKKSENIFIKYFSIMIYRSKFIANMLQIIDKSSK